MLVAARTATQPVLHVGTGVVEWAVDHEIDWRTHGKVFVKRVEIVDDV